MPYEIIRTERQPTCWAALGAAPVSAQISLVLVKHQNSEPYDDHRVAEDKIEPNTHSSHQPPTALGAHGP